MWPEKVLRQFQASSDLHGPYNKLLNHCFPPDTDFAVVPPQHLRDPAEFTIVCFEICFGVLIVELKDRSRRGPTYSYLYTRRGRRLNPEEDHRSRRKLSSG
jgi:hypothetical protein